MKKREIYKGWTPFDHKLRAFVSTITPQNRAFADCLLKLVTVTERDTSIKKAFVGKNDEEKCPFEMCGALSSEEGPDLNFIEDVNDAVTLWRRRSQMQ